jgi:cyanophycinase-like exopeptidase
MAERRLLMIAGSGETSPRMAPVHRAVVRRLEAALGRPARGVSLDTTYGFQENADHITGRTLRYFRDRVGIAMEPVHLRRSGNATADAAATDAVRRADFVFAGPGSPSYALHHWRASGVAWALREKLENGGALSFASAAAITIGAFAIPVYEIYKGGHDPSWLAGLDILSAAGLRAAVVPHFDNSEGGAHDSRFCYLGERRFLELEAHLPDDAWVIGIDENTALTIGLDEEVAEVKGPGVVTVREAGKSRRLEPGARFALAELRPARTGRAAAAARGAQRGRAATSVAEALDRRDMPAAVDAMLELEKAASGDDGRASEEARHGLRSALVRVGELAAHDRSENLRIDVLVRALLGLRTRARDAGDWATADEIRDALTDAGIAIRDTPAGPVWEPTGSVDPSAGSNRPAEP